MAKDITIELTNLANRTSHSENLRLNNSKAMSSTKITKDCVDRLIEDIDKTLKASK